MGKFIVGTFLILGFVFYEMSGGSDFAPEGQSAQVAEAEISAETPAADVTRQNSATLVNVAAEAEIPAQIIQAAVEEVVIVEEVTQAVVEVTEPVEIAVAPLDLRLVGGSRVNMRADAGTSYAVLDTLNGGTEVEVIEVSPTGWARVRVTGTGQIGWMAERLLTNG